MYLDFYGFREKPFNLTPDPRFVFLSKIHREAFAHLLYGINNRVGFICLTGEVGSGKTTVLRALLSQLTPESYRTALIFNPCLSAPELLQHINREFGIPSSPEDGSSPLGTLNFFLLQQNTEGRTVVLVIDEAQNLDAPVLEQIRLISNLETEKEKLVQIVLSGQPELIEILQRKEMRQLSQRISVRYHLEPMDLQETVGYIHHRLITAGGRDGVFSPRALKRIFKYSKGLPRLINAACDRALLTAYARDRGKINSRIAKEAIRDVKKNSAPSNRRWRLALIPGLIALGIIFGVVGSSNWHQILSRFYSSVPSLPKEEQIKQTPPLTEENLSRALASELGRMSESESARKAFNNLAGLWNVAPVPEGVDLKGLNALDRAARERNLHLHRFSGNLGALLRIGYPAMLELSLQPMSEKRFLSLTGVQNGELFIAPSIAGRNSVSFSDLERHWSGQSFILWKDPLNLAASLSSGSRGEPVKRLQALLKEIGSLSGPARGVYDSATAAAVREFQSSKGIESDGIVGDQTLMLLYRLSDHFEVPRLTGGRK